MKYRIAHVGAFDFENFGDLLFTDVLEKQLEKRIEIEEIVYFAPKACKMPGKDVMVHSVTELEYMAEETPFDAIVVGGGDLVHMLKTRTYMPHISENWVEYEVIYIWVIPSLVSQKFNIPIIWNAPGVPMYFTEENKLAVSMLCGGIDYLSVRDQLSKDVLSDIIDTDKIKVVPDTVLGIRDIISEQKLEIIFDRLPFAVQKKKYIFFQGNTSFSEVDIQECANTLLHLKRLTGNDIVLQPIGYALGDIEVLKKIRDIYPDEFILTSKRLDQYEILALIVNSVMYIGSSLHGCITANSYGIKNIVYNINHFRKTDGFVKLIGREDTRVYNSTDIMRVYDGLREIHKDEVAEYVDEIEKHFDRMAEIIKCGSKKKVYTAQSMAEYIYSNSTKIEKLQEEVKRLSGEVKSIHEKYEALRGYKEAYTEIITSFSWTITRPVRNLMDFIKSHRKKKK